MGKAINFLKIMLATGLIFGLFFGIGAGVTSVFNQVDRNEIKTDEDTEETMVRQDGKRTNILVLGVDARPGESKSRSDTMMLVSIDPKLDKAAIISIPRDTKVDESAKGFDKICVANVIGGPQYAVKTVEKLVDTKIDYYMELDFNGFKEVIDILGGVNINVPTRMYKPSEDIDLHPGSQRLNGRNALAFVRYRDYINGDIERAAAQQEFMQALANETLQAKTITKLPKLIKQANKHITTDMGITDMLRIASWAPGFTADSIITQTLPGSFYDVRDENGVLTNSYWLADKSSINGLIDNMMEGKTIAVIQGVVQESRPSKKKTDDEIDEDELNQDKYERAKLASPGHEEGSGYLKDDSSLKSNQNEEKSELAKSGEEIVNPVKPVNPEETDPNPPSTPMGPEGYI